METVVTEDEGREAYVISVIGELDHDSSFDLKRAISGLAPGRMNSVVFNLKACDFIDSSGLVALVVAVRDYASVFFEVKAESQVERVLSLSGVGELGTVLRPT